MIADWILDTLEDLGKKLLEKAQKRFPDPVKTPDAYSKPMSQSLTQPFSPSPSPVISTPAPQQVVHQDAPAKPKVSSDTVVFRIKPFKDNEFSTAYRQ
jgi:hypothetical protein